MAIAADTADTLVDEPTPHAPSTFGTILKNVAAFTAAGAGIGAGAALLPLGGSWAIGLPVGGVLGAAIGAVLGITHGMAIAGIEQANYQAALGRIRAREAAQAALDARVAVIARQQHGRVRVVHGHSRAHTHTRAS